MSEPFDVVVVGSCVVDLTCYAPRIPKKGETIRGSKFLFGYGGKGCNQCVAAKNLGAKCLLVAKIGNDFFGKNYFNNLLEHNIPRKYIETTAAAPTGVAQIIVSDSGENQIVVVPGANDLLSREDVIKATESIANAKVLVCQMEVPETATIEALEIKSKSNNGISILNAAPARPNLNPLLYTLPGIFCVNESEAEILVKMTIGTVMHGKEAVRRLLAKGCKEVVVTLGDEGVLYGKHGSDNVIHIPAQSVRVVDTTGAGDSFVGAMAFLLATQPNLTMEETLTKATRVAAFTVQRVGTQESFPFIEDMPDDFLEEGNR